MTNSLICCKSTTIYFSDFKSTNIYICTTKTVCANITAGSQYEYFQYTLCPQKQEADFCPVFGKF